MIWLWALALVYAIGVTVYALVVTWDAREAVEDLRRRLQDVQRVSGEHVQSCAALRQGLEGMRGRAANAEGRLAQIQSLLNQE